MKHEYEGKTYNIPDSYIQKTTKNLGITEQEAIWLWLEDNDIVEDAEEAKLTQAAKDNKIMQKVARVRNIKKTFRKKERKPDSTKEELISNLAEFLKDYATDITVVNVGKLITFKMNNDTFKLDLIRQRPPKK